MPVTSITYRSGPAPRAKPKACDRRVTKKHGLQIRVQSMARSFSINPTPIGRLFSNGRPVFEWRKPEELEVWDRHHLTAEERVALKTDR